MHSYLSKSIYVLLSEKVLQISCLFLRNEPYFRSPVSNRFRILVFMKVAGQECRDAKSSLNLDKFSLSDMN